MYVGGSLLVVVYTNIFNQLRYIRDDSPFFLSGSFQEKRERCFILGFLSAFDCPKSGIVSTTSRGISEIN